MNERAGGSTVPINAKYASDTTAIMEKLKLYSELDPYDPQRVQVYAMIALAQLLALNKLV
jgi:hypothetical protein